MAASIPTVAPPIATGLEAAMLIEILSPSRRGCHSSLVLVPSAPSSPCARMNRASRRARRPVGSGHRDDLEHLLIHVRPAPLVDVGAVGRRGARDVQALAAVLRSGVVV